MGEKREHPCVEPVFVAAGSTSTGSRGTSTGTATSLSALSLPQPADRGHLCAFVLSVRQCVT